VVQENLQNDVARRRVTVRGHVQGVFFRDSAREQAEANGVAGWIANRPDGTVEAVLEGPSDAVERVLEFLRSGPPRAGVEDVDVTDEEPRGLSGFEVR
jgi:acylphosphatase